MINTITILEKGREPALENNPVSCPVVTGKKLSIVQIVGKSSLVPTTAIGLIGNIGMHQFEGFRMPMKTKSVKKGFRMVAKW